MPLKDELSAHPDLVILRSSASRRHTAMHLVAESGCHFVTVGMSEVTFHKSVHPQSVLRFETTKARVGRTSVTYHVEVFRRHIESSEETGVFTTDITFVRIGADGAKMPIEKSS